MNFTYSGNPSSSLHDQVRFLMGDTNIAEPKLADEEVNFLLSEWVDPYLAAAAGADQLANTAASWFTYMADGTSMSLSEAQAKYQTMAGWLRQQYRRRNRPGAVYAGGVDRGDHEINAADDSVMHGSFALGMHDLPDNAGQYGGATPADLRGENPW